MYLCEAFAAGRPVVEPNTGSFAEIVGQAGIVYEPNDASHLADALERLLTDKQLFDACVEHATAQARERYDDTVMARQLTTLYDSTILAQNRNSLQGLDGQCNRTQC